MLYLHPKCVTISTLQTEVRPVLHEVEPYTEVFAIPCQHNDSRILILVDILKTFSDIGKELSIHRVQISRPVESDMPNMLNGFHNLEGLV